MFSRTIFFSPFIKLKVVLKLFLTNQFLELYEQQKKVLELFRKKVFFKHLSAYPDFTNFRIVSES